MQKLAPILTRLLESLTGGAGVTPATRAPKPDMKWAIDLEWASLDFNDVNG
jgi:hypothetical protein